MSNLNFLLQEVKKWRDEGVISEEQYNQITARYPQGKRMSTLPILAAVLIALSVLTFIASNWDGMSHGARLGIIVVSLVASYGAAEWFHKKAYERLGIAFAIIGVAIYGAGFFLIGQMYHLSANPATAFYLWFVGAVLVAWHYRSRALAVMALGIFAVAGMYGIDSRRETMDIVLYYLLFAVGMVPLIWKFRSRWFTVIALITVLGAAMVDINDLGEGLAYLALYLLTLVLAQLLPTTASPIPGVLRMAGYIGIMGFSMLIIFADEIQPYANMADVSVWVVMLVLMAAYIFTALRKKQLGSLIDLIPFIPLMAMYAVTFMTSEIGVRPDEYATRGVYEYADLIQQLALFLFTLGMIMSGERMRDIFRINVGAVLFGITCFIAYVNLAWDFMDKSLFFLIGGVLLLVLSYFIERKRRQWVQEAKEGGDQV
ncbi:DUF2157 domain-containing protein [Brevibacillus dissolubilis]|uniref:DUF2157 domain-containing protein n=1 Tax=Brevibacillus dissolubilis TaxID=1844116 RepID=UPI00159B91D5|nr:DUF2157 domain-containing protein [Brevibacillus dissolubilis]